MDAVLERAPVSAPAASAASEILIDCDIHPYVSMKDVHARMSKRAKLHANLGSDAVPARDHNRFLHPTGPLRLDAVPPGGGLAGSDPVYAVQDYLDRYKISVGMICSTQSHAVVSWADDGAVNEFLAAINDLFLEQWYAVDRRYRMLVCVSPHNPDAAIREMERLADAPGVVGVHVPTAELALGSPTMLKFFEAAAALKMPVCFHPNGSEGTFINSPGHAGFLTRSFAERHANLAQSGQAQLVSLALGGTLARIPDLRIVFAEFGFSWVGPVMWRLDQVWHRNGGDDGIMRRPPSEYIAEQVRFTTQPYDEPDMPRQLQPLLDAMKAEKTLVFSSDYPHWDTDDPQFVLTNRLPQELRARVASESAIECFGDRLCL